MRISAMIVLACLLFTAPVLAQRKAARLPGGLWGKVLEVSAKEKRAQLAFLALASSSDAPGKVPDEMAQRAAELTARADELEQQGGKPQLVSKLREQIEQLLRWREVTLSLTSKDHVPLVALKRGPIGDITRGMRLRLAACAESAEKDRRLPTRVTLSGNAVQVGSRARLGMKRLPSPKRSKNVYFEIVGEAIATSPLTLQIGDHAVIVETSPKYRFIQQAPATMSDLKPGYNVIARAQMRGELAIGKIDRLIIIFHDNDNPLAEEDDVEL